MIKQFPCVSLYAQLLSFSHTETDNESHTNHVLNFNFAKGTHLSVVPSEIAIIWCTGFVIQHSQVLHFVRVPDLFDNTGSVKHLRGVTCEHGLYILGFRLQTRLGSSLLRGTTLDAVFVADHIAESLGSSE